ncbi:MAG: hypothetical protein ACJ75J_04660, partial [Cytophagaceae bacterium]
CKEKDAMAAVLSPQKGRFTLNADKVQKNAKGEFIALIEASMSPLGSTKKLSTRAGLLTNTIELQKFFAAGDSLSQGRFLVIGKGKYVLSKDAFPLDDKHFFFIRYSYEGQQVNKKLAFSGDTLFIDKTIYQIDGKDKAPAGASDMKLYQYVMKDKAESLLITDFHPVFIAREQMKSDLKTLVDQLKVMHKNNFELVSEDVLFHVNAYYGKPDPEELKKIVKEMI